MKKVSPSHEDYLETIIVLGGTTEQSVRSVDLANQMGVSKPSVSKAITALKEKGFLDQPFYGDITLKPEGYDYGMSVLRRHRLLTRFLTEVLGVEQKVAEHEACAMEHAISEDTFEKWNAFMESR